VASKPVLPCEVLTGSSTVQKMTNNATKPIAYVDIYVEGADIRWVDHPDDTISASVGTRLGDGKSLRYDGDFSQWRFVAVSGSPTVRIHKYAVS